MSGEDPKQDPRVYLAAERTFLAWIRTGLALMAFGFVVARFGLFLRELAASHGTEAAQSTTVSLPLGIGLVLLGVLINLFAAWGHVRYVKALKEGSVTNRPSSLAIVLAVVLAAAGLTMAFYLGRTQKADLAPQNLQKSAVP